MNLLTRKTGLLAGLVCMSFCSLPVMAQTAPDAGGAPAQGQGAGNGDRPRFDPAQFRQRRLDETKTQLGMSDDEFKAIQPKLEKVFEAQRESFAGGGMGGRFGGRRGGGRGGPNGGGGNGGAAPADATATPPADAPKPSAVQEKSSALRKLLEDKEAKPEDIKAALQAVRDARTKAKEDLTKAQEDLKSVLTQRQEAVLVTRGVLE